MRRRPRAGFTLLELMVVLAAIVILGAVFLPSISAFQVNTRVKAAADTVRGRLADARRKAMEDGQPYRVSISEDGRRVRVSAESADLTGETARADGSGGRLYQVEDELPEQVTADLQQTDATAAVPDAQNGWRRVATFLPDATCREESARVILKEDGVRPLVVVLRGLTGQTYTETAGGP